MRGADVPALKTINSATKIILKDMVSSAKEKRSRSVPALCEAYSSLKSCPVQFTSTQQLLSLAGFGEALVDKLETLLCEWCEANGKRYEGGRTVSTHSKLQHVDRREDSQKKSDNDDAEETDSDLDTGKSRRQTEKKGHADISQIRAPKPTKKKASASKEPKLFVPQHRTGTHGILVALFTLTPDQPVAESEEEGDMSVSSHYHSKATIIHFAQPYSESKYVPKTNPSSSHGFGGNFHSAWSAMKTLINRGYVYRRGNPACFGLSHEGWHVSQLCAAREKGLTAGSNVDELKSVASTSKATQEEKTKKKAPKSSSTQIPRVSSSSASIDSPFLYTYLTDSEPPRHTKMRSQARVRLCDEDFRMVYCITFAKELEAHLFVRSCVGGLYEGKSGLMCGWVKEAVCNGLAPGIGREPAPNEREAQSLASSSSRKMAWRIDEDHDGNEDQDEEENEENIPPRKAASRGNRQMQSTDVPPSPAKMPERRSASRQTRWSQESARPLQSGVCSQACSIDVIELLTSSDVELDLPRFKLQAKRHLTHSQADSDSDSDLSDILAPSKPIKAKKRKS
jgi:hypothetical protein